MSGAIETYVCLVEIEPFQQFQRVYSIPVALGRQYALFQQKYLF